MARKKRKASTLVLLLGVLLLMILLYCLVINKKEAEEVKEEVINLTTLESDRVTEISYTINGTTLSYSKSDDTWFDESDNKAPVNQDYITNMLSKISNLSADKIVVEEAEDLGEYGLDKPTMMINVTSDDKTTVELSIGDSLGVGSGYYAKLADKNTVYAVAEDIYSAFNHTQTEMLLIEEFPEITTTNITKISVTKDNNPIFKADYDQSAADAGEYYAWKISKPYKTIQKGDPTKFDSYFESYSSVSLSECVDYKGSDLSKYGLDNPSATIDLSYYTETTEDSANTTEGSGSTDTTSDASTTSTSDGEASTNEEKQEATPVRTDNKVKILVGDKNDDGKYYVQVKADGREYGEAVYTIATSAIDAMLDITPYDYVCNLVQLVDITSLDHLAIQANDQTYTLTVTPNTDKKTETKDEADDLKDSDSSDEDSEEVSDSLYYYNGNKVEEKAFKDLYQDLIGITTAGEIKKEVSDSTPVYEFDFTRNSDSLEELHVSYLPYDGVNFYRVSINGEENFLVEKAAVDKVIKELTEFKTK